MRRRLGFLLIFGAAISLVVASTAWACGVLATLKVNSSVGAPNQELTATGKNYSSSASASPVQIRWNSRNGQVLQNNATPDASGNITTTFRVPANANPGWYVVMATQTVNGVPKSGTPGRTTLRVEGAAAQVAPWSSSKPTGPGGAGASVALDPAPSGSPALPTLLGIVLSLGLLGGGLTLIGRGRNRTATRPPLGA